jgi:hypothetical protein
MIRLENVGKRFDDRWIFRGVNLTVSAKESVAFGGRKKCFDENDCRPHSLR